MDHYQGLTTQRNHYSEERKIEEDYYREIHYLKEIGKIHHYNSTPSTTFGSLPPTTLGTLKVQTPYAHYIQYPCVKAHTQITTLNHIHIIQYSHIFHTSPTIKLSYISSITSKKFSIPALMKFMHLKHATKKQVGTKHFHGGKN